MMDHREIVDMMEEFNWRLHPEGWKILNEMVAGFEDGIVEVRDLRKDIMERTSTRLVDWIDHLLVPWSWIDEDRMKEAGFSKDEVTIENLDLVIFTNDNSTLFPIFATEREISRIYVKVENMEDFAQKWNSSQKIEGKRWGSRRKVMVAEGDGLSLGAIERRGYDGYMIPELDDEDDYLSILTSFRERDRSSDGFSSLEEIIDDGIGSIGADRTADAFFYSERRYWESRNSAGRIQLKRQNELGLGWGNDDHHTFRSSRENFSKLISVLERIGMKPRERFYAGEQAGWGAQVMEHKVCDIAVFADVDLTPEEKDGDFAHTGLETLDSLGTVGLWTGLHGESIHSAGLHHIAALVDFDRAMKDSQLHGIENMAPFSSFSYLKQCFTEGERWEIPGRRDAKLMERGLIVNDQFERFSAKGALGSHLEYIERNDGFKGFNQTAVSDIISRTDPRK